MLSEAEGFTAVGRDIETLIQVARVIVPFMIVVLVERNIGIHLSQSDEEVGAALFSSLASCVHRIGSIDSLC